MNSVLKILSLPLRKLRSARDRAHRYRMFRFARIWSNQELKRFSGLFTGKVVNVSAWEDKDKEGSFYRDYFSSASSYFITNYGTDQGVIQGQDNEYFLDLEAGAPPQLKGAFDVVFNHTVLEHVYDFRTAFSTLCDLSSDLVVIVVPWAQALHANYGDYWRFSPQAVARLFADNGLSTHVLDWSKKPGSAVYVFAIASKHPERWSSVLGEPVDIAAPEFSVPPVEHAGRRLFG